MTLVLVLKKKDEPIPPPQPDLPPVNPYTVLEYDEANMQYTLGRNKALDFTYPFNETFNNKIIETISLMGSVNFANSQTLGLQFITFASKA